jgi:hypothetical protein
MTIKTLLRICVFVSLTLSSSKSFASIVWHTLPQLVHDSPTIVTGNITIQDQRIILNIEKTLKGQEHRQLRILYHHWFDVPDPQFKNGENVLLFLYIPDPNKERLMFPNTPNPKEGEMYLFGLGDQAKWPRVYPEKVDRHKPPRHYPKLQDNASLRDIEDVVERLLEIENAPNLDEKVKLCTEYIRSSNRLLQLTALQYAMWGHLWAPPPGEPRGRIPKEISRKRFNIRRNLSGEVLSLSLVDSNEPSIRAESIRFLRYASPSQAMPNLIRRITDEDRLVRSVTSTVLNTLSMDLKITGSFVKYRPDEPPEHLRSIQHQWNDWWQNNKDRLKSTVQQRNIDSGDQQSGGNYPTREDEIRAANAKEESKRPLGREPEPDLQVLQPALWTSPPFLIGTAAAIIAVVSAFILLLKKKPSSRSK